MNSTLPESYSENFDRMLQDTFMAYPNNAKFQSKKFTAFWPRRGKNFVQDEGLMVIGRAVNGWTKESWAPSDLQDKSTRERLIDGIRKLSEDRSSDRGKLSSDKAVNIRPALEIENSEYDCPLSWVMEKDATRRGEGYNTNRSAFWRMAKKAVRACYPEAEKDRLWSSHLCWSNLYKIAAAVKGNPSSLLKEAQQTMCVELLQEEVATWRPKRILVLAGYD